MKFIRSIIFLFLSINIVPCLASPFPDVLPSTKQLLVVTTPGWNSVTGTLQRYQKKEKHWMRIGNVIPIVVGKNGMAQGVSLPYDHSGVPLKQEGDLRTPTGVYRIGTVFGFAKKMAINFHYLPLKETTFCVDDQQSKYYNQIIDTAKIAQDWKQGTGEYMYQQPLYQIGASVAYNTQPIMRGKGSCIFLHIWRHPHSGTASCIAMDEKNLRMILNWLDEEKKPMIMLGLKK